MLRLGSESGAGAQPVADGRDICSFRSESGSPGDAEHGGEGHFPVAILLSVVAIHQPAVVFVQYVGQRQVEGYLFAGLPVGAQIKYAVASQLRRIGRIGVTAADRRKGSAESYIAECAVQVQHCRTAGAVRAGVAGLAITRIDNADSQLTLPAKHLLLQRGFKAVDPGT